MTKKITPIWPGMVENGKLVLDHDIAFKVYLHQLDGSVELIVRRTRRQRSEPQNDYYWGVVIKMISDYIGEDNQKVHEDMKYMFLKDISHKTINNRVLEFVRIKSTTELSTVEFVEYTEEIKRWAAQFLALNIPDPNQVINNIPE